MKKPLDIKFFKKEDNLIKEQKFLDQKGFNLQSQNSLQTEKPSVN